MARPAARTCVSSRTLLSAMRVACVIRAGSWSTSPLSRLRAMATGKPLPCEAPPDAVGDDHQLACARQASWHTDKFICIYASKSKPATYTPFWCYSMQGLAQMREGIIPDAGRMWSFMRTRAWMLASVVAWPTSRTRAMTAATW